MRTVDLSRIADWVDGALIQGVPSLSISSISTNSREVSVGDLFVALKGDRFDAHDFVSDVDSREVAAMLLSSLPPASETISAGIIYVKDTLKALQRLAFYHRKNSPDLRVVGVTGSNGKTTTKDFLGAVLQAAGPVNVTDGNLNNHIGLPLTILSGSEEDRFGVWEMGMNHPGEIEVLAEIASPDIGVITNIGTAHIEHMGSRDAIAAEKAELAIAIPESGYCVMPVSDAYYGFVSERVRAEMLVVGIEEGAVQARALSVGEDGRARFDLVSDFGPAAPVSLPVMGRHMVINALLAAAVGMKEGLTPATVADCLSEVKLSGGRLQERKVGGFSFLDDSYNANPDSMAAALGALVEASVSGRRVAVFGFMGELGKHEESAHRELGARVAESGADALITVGERAALINEGCQDVETNQNFDDHEKASEFLKEFLSPDDLVLVKGSRAAGMEKIIEVLNQD